MSTGVHDEADSPGAPAPSRSAPAGEVDGRARAGGESLVTADTQAERRLLRPVAAPGRDLLLLLVGGLVGVAVDDGLGLGELGWVVLAASVSVLTLDARGAYRFRLGVQAFDGLGRVVSSIAFVHMLLLVVCFLVVTDLALARTTVVAFVASAGAITLVRLVATLSRRRSLSRGGGGLPTLLIGAGSVGQLVARRLADRPELGLRPVGFLDRNPPAGDLGLPVLGASWDLETVVRRHGVRLVIVTFSTAPHDVLLRLIRRCRALGVDISLVPRLFEEITSRIEVEHLGGIALLRSSQPDPRGWQFAVKYVVDRAVASVALLLLSPVFVACAIAVRASSPGPIFFRQRRAGLDGREFEMLKFRTMRGSPAEYGEADAEWAARIRGDGDGVGPPFDRRTRVGLVLRRWSLDELPQLINIARGDMSLVGPRPERLDYVRAFADHVPRYDDRHRVKSGLTGWAQVHGLRGETSLPDRVEWDNHYIENWSLWLDLKILMLTLPALLRTR